MAENHASAAARAADADDHQRPALCRSSFLPAYSDVNDDGLEGSAFRPLIVSVSGDSHSDDDRPFSGGGRVPVPPFSWRRLWLFTGPGLLMSVAFLDPGNLEGDLQAGAAAGDALLWLLLWTTAMGLLVQLLSARLGVATGRHLAELCRGGYPDWARRALWLMAEVAMVSADIQEVIGSAVAIRIHSHGFMPLWAGVVITGLDCFIFLSLENYGVRKLEGLFAVLIATMALSFAWMFIETKPNGKDLIIGILVPKLSSRTIRQAVGLVGCVITPHNVFLHSALVQSRKIDPDNEHWGFYGTKEAGSIGLENAGHFLQEKFGGEFFPILYIWGVGLLAAGTSSTITGTYAVIMSGFLNWKLKRWIRALITRSFAIVPTIAVAVWFNTSDSALDVLNEWLNVLQLIQIPFALIPLITLVSKEEVMGVFKIGPRTQIATWIIASVPIIATGYLLMDFFSSEMRGVLSGSVICVAVLVYASFLFYLIIRGMKLPNSSI
uniref:Metal transporter n=1 Tax=Oryza glumipatula TaxID=40148 RepID=A0A0D9ZAE6_9ORYZ